MSALFLVGRLSAAEAASEKRSALQDFMRDRAKVQAPLKPAPDLPASTAPTPSEPVKMVPFVVQEKRGPRLDGLEEAMAKERDFESRALYHKKLSNGAHLEIGLPPTPGGKGGGFALPLLRLSW